MDGVLFWPDYSKRMRKSNYVPYHSTFGSVLTELLAQIPYQASDQLHLEPAKG